MNSAALSSAAAAASSSSSSVAGSVVSHGSVAAVAVVSGASASPSAVANQGSTPAAAAAAAAVAAVAAATVLVSSNNSSSTGSKTLTATDSGNAAAAVKAKTSIGLHFVAGGIGGALGAIVTCPLEVTKTRLQSSLYTKQARMESIVFTQNASSTFGISSRPSGISRLGNVVYGQFGAAIETMSDIYRTEGVRALWKGLGPNLVGIIPSRAIHFSTYNKSKEVLANWRGGKEDPLVHMLSAITAGVTVATITCPLWLVKTRMQLQSQVPGAQRRYRNSFHCVAEVIKNEGFFALYRGLGASYLGVMEGTLQFVIYEQLKLVSSSHGSSKPDWLEYFMMAASSKLIAAVATYPHEVLRTRMREPVSNGVLKYRTLGQSIRTIWAEEGAYAFYNGIGAHVLRVVPNAAIMFLGYEAVVHYFSSPPTLTGSA